MQSICRDFNVVSMSILPAIIRLIILALSVIYLKYDLTVEPIEILFYYKIGYICILSGKWDESMV